MLNPHKTAKDLLHLAKSKLAFRWLPSTWRLRLFLIYLILLLLCAIVLLVPKIFGFLAPQPIFAPGKQIMTNTLQLRESWRWVSEGRITHQLITNEELIILGISGDWADKIIVLDAQTGQLIWQHQFSGNLKSLDADNQRVYAGEIRYVQAYDLYTGQKLWQGARQSKYKKGGLYVYAKEPQLEVYDYDLSNSPNYGNIFILDPQTGETLRTIEQPFLFFQSENTLYLRVQGGFVAEDKMTEETLWKLSHEWYVQRWPIFVDDIVYLDVRDVSGSIYAVDIKTGEIRWQSQGIKGYNPNDTFTAKVAYGAQVIYVMGQNGIIVGLDYQTGQELGRIEVSPPSTYYDPDGSIRDFTYDRIVASDKFVAVYYDDSRELIVFKRQEVSDNSTE